MTNNHGLEESLAKLGRMDRISVRTEIKMLPDVLELGEEVHAVRCCQHDKKWALLVLTDNRIFIYEQGTVRRKVIEFPLGTVSTVSHGTGWTGDTLEITASNRKEVFKQVSGGKEPGLTFISAYKDIRRSEKVLPEKPVSAPADDVLTQLEKLGKLRDAGVISEDEFAAKKADLLGRL